MIRKIIKTEKEVSVNTIFFIDRLFQSSEDYKN